MHLLIHCYNVSSDHPTASLGSKAGKLLFWDGEVRHTFILCENKIMRRQPSVSKRIWDSQSVLVELRGHGGGGVCRYLTSVLADPDRSQFIYLSQAQSLNVSLSFSKVIWSFHKQAKEQASHVKESGNKTAVQWELGLRFGYLATQHWPWAPSWRPQDRKACVSSFLWLCSLISQHFKAAQIWHWKQSQFFEA